LKLFSIPAWNSLADYLHGINIIITSNVTSRLNALKEHIPLIFCFVSASKPCVNSALQMF